MQHNKFLDEEKENKNKHTYNEFSFSVRLMHILYSASKINFIFPIILNHVDNNKCENVKYREYIPFRKGINS